MSHNLTYSYLGGRQPYIHRVCGGDCAFSLTQSKWKRTLSDARESKEHPFEEVSLLTSDTGMAGIAGRDRDSLDLLGEPAARPYQLVR